MKRFSHIWVGLSALAVAACGVSFGQDLPRIVDRKDSPFLPARTDPLPKTPHTVKELHARFPFYQTVDPRQAGLDASSSPEKNADPDQPAVLLDQLQRAQKDKKIDADLLERADRVARRYPNDLPLQMALGSVYGGAGGLPADPAMAASIYLAVLDNPHLDKMDDGNIRRTAALECAVSFIKLGYPDAALAVLGPAYEEAMKDPKTPADMAERMSEVMLDICLVSGRYEDALDHYRRCREAFTERWTLAANQAADLILGAVMVGAPAETQAALFKENIALNDSRFNVLLAMAGKIGEREVLDFNFYFGQAHAYKSWWAWRAFKILQAQAELNTGIAFDWKDRYSLVNLYPAWRPAWILYDAHDRLDPLPESMNFYLTLEWLWKDDPWVRRAIRDYNRRVDEQEPIGAEELLDRFKSYDTTRWPAARPESAEGARRIEEKLPPFAVAGALRRLVEKKDFAKACELALRYHHWAVARANPHGVYLSNYLIHVVDHAARP